MGLVILIGIVASIYTLIRVLQSMRNEDTDLNKSK